MNSKEAIELVKEALALQHPEETVLNAEHVDDYSDYWYITRLDSTGTASVGGYAYVVNRSTSNIFAVPGNMPPHFNLRSVVDGDAIDIKDLHH